MTNFPHNNPWIDQQLPDRFDMEQLVLGAALTDPDAWLQISDLLSENDFSLDKNRLIFTASSTVHDRGEELNWVSIAKELIRKDKLQAIDGLRYFNSLTDCFPRLVNLAGYCEIVKTASIKRQAIITMAGMIQRCFDPGEDARELLVDVERATELLNSTDRKNRWLGRQRR